MTNHIKKYKIYSPEDFHNFSDDENTRIEIYAKNCVFEQTEFKGSILLRGENCSFPNLKFIGKHLSVDAPFCSLDTLERINGNCTIHNEVNLDVLKEIKGNLKCIVNFNFKKLEKVGGNILSKKVELTAKGKELQQNRKPIAINFQYEVEKLSSDGIFDIEVYGENLVFPHSNISGKIVLKCQKADFPNLTSLQGSLHCGPKNELIEKCRPSFPLLENITRNLELKDTFFTFENLLSVKGNISLARCETNFPVLEKSGSIKLNSYSSTKFPELVGINGSLTNEDYTSTKKYDFPKLKKIKGRFYKKGIDCPLLEEVGDLKASEDFELNYLQKINGSFHSSKHFKSNSLKHINILEIENNAFYSPALESINHYLYKKDEFYETLAKNVYFKITNQLFISKNSFIISRFSFELGLKQNKYSLKELVRILKLRHNSFQNFETRELKREWTSENHPEFQKIIEKIRLLWDETEAISFQEFFTSENRNFRLFCFNYIGVGTLMKELNAEKINSQSIEVNHIEYDANGNKEYREKTNTYEVYRVENQKFGLWTWNLQDNFSYAVKCWCPSTKKEHWLWIEEQYKDNALTAIASTFRVHENIIPYIKCLKRQGDLLFCELKEEITPKGSIRALTAPEYFRLLEAES